MEFEVYAATAADRRIDRLDIGRKDQSVGLQPRAVEAHAADDFQLADVEARLNIAREILFERAFAVDILGQHDRRELQPAGAADILVHIVDEIPERVLADTDETRAGAAEAHQLSGANGKSVE